MKKAIYCMKYTDVCGTVQITDYYTDREAMIAKAMEAFANTIKYWEVDTTPEMIASFVRDEGGYECSDFSFYSVRDALNIEVG